MYNEDGSEVKACFNHSGAVLDAAFGADGKTVFSGGLERLVRRWDVAAGEAAAGDALGEHSKAIKAVEYMPSLGVVATGSWDSTVATWDARAAPGSGARASTISAPERVYSMHTSSATGAPLLAAACAKQQLAVWDLRNPEKPLLATQVSALKHMLRCVAFWADGAGVAVGSIEGRVAMEPLPGRDTPEGAGRSKRFSFKCHRKKMPSRVDVVYPVNALAFHPVHGTFATGGGDGAVVTWDATARKKVHAFPTYATSISALAFSGDGQRLAVAVSYDHSAGTGPEGTVPPDTLFIRHMAAGEVEPKAKK